MHWIYNRYSRLIWWLQKSFCCWKLIQNSDSTNDDNETVIIIDLSPEFDADYVERLGKPINLIKEYCTCNIVMRIYICMSMLCILPA